MLCGPEGMFSTLATSGTHQHEQHAKGFFSGVAEEACAPVHFQGLSVRPHLFCTSVCEQQDLVYNVVVKLKKQEAFAFAGRSCMCRLLAFLFMGCRFGSCSGPCHEFPGRNACNFTLFEPEPNMFPLICHGHRVLVWTARWKVHADSGSVSASWLGRWFSHQTSTAATGFDKTLATLFFALSPT